MRLKSFPQLSDSEIQDILEEVRLTSVWFSASRHSYFTFTSSTDFLLCVHVLFFSPSSSSEKMEYCHSFFPWRSWRLNHNMRREKKWLNGSEQIYAAKKKRMFLKCLSHLLLTFLKKEPKQINYLIKKKRHK